MGIAAAHGIAVDAPGGDARSPTALQRFVQAEHQRTRRQKGGHELAQQAAGGAGTPFNSALDSVILVPACLLTQAYNAQRSGHRAFARSQDGSEQQELHVSEDAATK